MRWLTGAVAALAILAILPVGSFAQLGSPAQSYHAATVTCSTIEALLVGGNNLRIGLRLLNLGPENLYVGGRDIAPARSYPVHSALGGALAGHAFVLSGSEASGDLYCVADGTVRVKVFQILR